MTITYTVTYTIIQDNDEAVVNWHLADSDGDVILSAIGRELFIENCDLMYSVDVTLLPIEKTEWSK